MSMRETWVSVGMQAAANVAYSSTASCIPDQSLYRLRYRLHVLFKKLHHKVLIRSQGNEAEWLTKPT